MKKERDTYFEEGKGNIVLKKERGNFEEGEGEHNFEEGEGAHILKKERGIFEEGEGVIFLKKEKGHIFLNLLI